MNLSNGKEGEDYRRNEHMEKPTIKIEGTEFIFDIDSILLIEKGNLYNEIDFRYMLDQGTHYGMIYSPANRNYPFIRNAANIDELFSDITEPAKAPDRPVYVEIPRIGAIDPQGLSSRYGCTLEDIAFKSDFEIMVDQDVFRNRITGAPVTIEFPGKTFIVDAARNMLLPQDGMGEPIELGKFHYDYYYEDREVYHLFYNILEARVEDPLRDGTRGQTVGRLILEVPPLYDLDPIGYNMSQGRDPRYCLIYHEPKMCYVPNAVRWSTYGINILNSIKCKNMEEKERTMGRELPIVKIEGTEFLLDVDKVQLREKENPGNIISFFEMDDEGQAYRFEYNRKSRNLPEPWDHSADITTVRLLQLVELDPEGMCLKYGLSAEDIKGKTDFELMVDQKALQERLQGRLTTVDIVGHTFYVDIPMDRLRPKDDFLSKGISFSEIDHYYSEEERVYAIPYNPERHEFQELDYDNLTEFPKELIVVEFPNERVLDPVGWNRKHLDSLLEGLKETPVYSHFIAKIVEWKETGLQETIDHNRKRLGMDGHGEKIQKNSRQRKGRGI
ncbi:hypothetical protein [Sphingobacterium siyangense]|uniref:hypothetical protein n=1 Tax=Sphingobacterium siyangense TaxID=459529 RepID=UPI001964D4A1|nr:hypothetical protein [Sphingobacterium siyangense]QRY55577.1 hypothetical protein JVX97_16180 [Sphingobacterium siyangense]